MTDEAPKRPIGRPPMPFDQEIADHVCERIASEAVSLKKICADENMPSMTTVFKWLRNEPAFAQQYADAREAQADLLFDETIEIADETKADYVKRLNFDGPLEGWEVNGEAIARSKLRIDTRKWIAAHLRPKKYGDKLGLDQTVSVSPELGALMDRIAGQGQRLTPAQDDEADGGNAQP